MNFRHGITVTEIGLDAAPSGPATFLQPIRLPVGHQLVVDAPVDLGLLHATAGATRTIVAGALPPGLELDLDTLLLTGTPLTAGEYAIVLRETLTAARNSPFDSEIALSVEAAEPSTIPPLTAIAYTPLLASITDDTAPGTHLGTLDLATRSPESTLTLAGVDAQAGHLVLGSTGTVLLGMASLADVSALSFAVTETLAGAPNSPRTSGPWSITVTAIEPQPDPDPIVYISPPTVLTAPLMTNTMIDVNPGETSEPVDSKEIRLQSTPNLEAPGTVFLDWTELPAGFVSATPGLPCYVASRAIQDNAVVATTINPTNMGPWVENTATPGNEPYFVGRYVCRGSIGYTETPADMYVIANENELESDGPLATPSTYAEFPDMIARSRDGSEWAATGGNISSASSQGRNRSTAAPPVVAGRMAVTTSTARHSWALPNGRYKVRMACSDPGNATDANYPALYDGLRSDGLPIIEGHAPTETRECAIIAPERDQSGNMVYQIVDRDVAAAMLLEGAQGSGFSPEFQVTQGRVSFYRAPDQTAGSAFLNAIQFVRIPDAE